MAWDDDKSTGDELTADEWDAHVIDQKAHASRHERGGVDEVDVDDVLRDTEANLSNYTPDTDELFRATDTGAVYLGDGANWNLLPITTESVTTVTGTTVSDIADAVANQQYVKLQPGTTYTHDGTSTITSTPTEHTVVDAWGANIEVRGDPVVSIADSDVNNGWFRWYGGDFRGTENAGEVAFELSDAIFNYICPENVEGCEAAIAMYNDDLWCEFNYVDMRCRKNAIDVALIGNAGSPPAGSSLRSPSGGGTHSFRNTRLQLRSNTNDDMANNYGSLGTSYGLYTSDTKVYASDLRLTVSGGADSIGWRMDGEGYPGTTASFHYETPGATSGGTGIKVDSLTRQPWPFVTRIGGGADTTIDNTQDLDIVHLDMAIDQSGSAGRFGPLLKMDDEVVEGYTTAWTDRADGRSKSMRQTLALQGNPGEHMLRFMDEATQNQIAQFEWRDAANRLAIMSPNNSDWDFQSGIRLITRDTGSSGAPVLELGNNGAGLYVNGSGELVGVDEAGNTTTLT